jgi:hypothetical protein
MSYTSQYNLNIRVSGLEGQINNLISTNNLTGVLTNGNSAGTNDIDMNGQDILDVNNIDVSTINGSAYPPVVAGDTLQTVLTAGDTSDLSIILVDDINTPTKQNIISATDITLNDITTGDNSVLTTQTLTLNQSVSTNSAVLNGNGTFALTDNGNTCSLKLEPLTGLELYSSVFPTPYNSFAGLTNTGLTLLDNVSGDNNSLTAFNLTFNEILNGKTGVFGAGGAVITESSDSTSLIPTGMTITYASDTMSFGYDSITHFNFANADKMYINSNTGIRLQIDNGGAGAIYLDENYLTIACENIHISSGIDFIIGCNATGINVNQQQDAPLVLYENDFPNAGFAVGVPTIEYYKSGRNTTAGDIICSQKFYAKNYNGVKTLFSKIEASVRNTSNGNDDGAVGIFATLNGVLSEFFRFNGADGENNTFYPIDLNNQAIKSSTGNINITANASTGTGNITLTPKATGSLILNNLPTSAVGLPTGAVWNNLGVLSIAP